MIWLWGVAVWWLVDHGVNWYAFGGLALCIVLLMWWAIVNDSKLRESVTLREE